jgi:hypothetical protein
MSWIAQVARRRLGRPGHGEVIAQRDIHPGPEAIEREPFDEGLARRGEAIEEEQALPLADEEIEQDLPLGREQGRIDEGVGRHATDIVGDKPLEEIPGFGPGDGDHGAVVEPQGHGGQVVPRWAVAKAQAWPYWSPRRPGPSRQDS